MAVSPTGYENTIFKQATTLAEHNYTLLIESYLHVIYPQFPLTSNHSHRETALRQNVQSGYGGNPAFYSMGTMGYFLGGKAVGASR
jgi:hypothetical protein